MTRGRELRELKDSLNFKRKAPEGRPARRRAEEKDASDESTVLEVFLHCIAFRVRPCGGLAQLGERVLCKHEVVGSSPISSTSFSLEKHIIWADSSVG